MNIATLERTVKNLKAGPVVNPANAMANLENAELGREAMLTRYVERVTAEVGLSSEMAREVAAWCYGHPPTEDELPEKPVCVHSWFAHGDIFRCCHCGVTVELR